MTALAIFENADWSVRTMVIDGEPWFVARDVCAALDIANVGNASARLDQDGVRQTDIIDSLGRSQSTTIISESGLYELILRSDKPGAKTFRRWVTSEVLPAIRRTGQYVPRELSRLELIEIARDAEVGRLQAEAKIAELAPKAEAFDEFLSADEDTLTMEACAKALGFGRNTFFKLCRRAGVIQGNNLPYQQYMHHFDVVLRTWTDKEGRTHPAHTTMVRPSGVAFLRRKLTDLFDVSELAHTTHQATGIGRGSHTKESR